MATSTAQRTGIWIIAIVLTVGTLAGFLAMILAPQNEASDSAVLQNYQKAYQEAQTKQGEQQSKLDQEAETLSGQYFTEFNSYSTRVGAYDSKQAQEKLVTTDLKTGDGDVIDENTTYAVYYLGWLPDGKIFDSKIDGQKLKAPFVARPGGTIAGWGEGVKGMKIGGVRELTIPSAKGYGEAGQGEIPANSPLKFVLMPFRKLETINQPEIPKELLQTYGG